MPFTLSSSNKAEMIEILSTWEQSFKQKTKDTSKKAMMLKALSIAGQMQGTLAEQKHAHLWIAKHSETNAPMAMELPSRPGYGTLLHRCSTSTFLKIPGSVGRRQVDHPHGQGQQQQIGQPNGFCWGEHSSASHFFSNHPQNIVQ